MTSAADTRAAAAELVRLGVDLILFAGGDGTARDIHEIVGDACPCSVSRPASRCTPPFSRQARSTLATSRPRSSPPGTGTAVREAEVVDVDEEAAREGRLETRLYGAAPVPVDRLRMQAAKTRAVAPDEAALDAVCRAVADGMDPRRIYVLGPGTTTRLVAAHLGIPKRFSASTRCAPVI